MMTTSVPSRMTSLRGQAALVAQPLDQRAAKLAHVERGDVLESQAQHRRADPVAFAGALEESQPLERVGEAKGGGPRHAEALADLGRRDRARRGFSADLLLFRDDLNNRLRG
jgi:hypothetical protein